MRSTSRPDLGVEDQQSTAVDGLSDDFGEENYLKNSHQNHNRRMDFPHRKSAGGSSALHKIS